MHRQDWVTPPTKMYKSELIKEGHYAAFYLDGLAVGQPALHLVNVHHLQYLCQLVNHGHGLLVHFHIFGVV